MDAATVLKSARQRSGLTLRALARRAGTSHSTLAAYEAGRVSPSVDTLDRIVGAAGLALDTTFERRHTGGGPNEADRGDELTDVLELAAQFPARASRHLDAPIFGRS